MLLTGTKILPMDKLSRKITLDIDHSLISVRPIIKNADNEAAHTLVESYRGISTPYCSSSKKMSKDMAKTYVANHELFKAIIGAAASESRDFAIQVDGCKGILLWASSRLNYLHKAVRWKLPGIFGWYQAMRMHLAHQSMAQTIHRRIMGRREHLVIMYLGVLPHERKKGYGSALLEHVLSKADEAGLPVYAEITNESAMSLLSHAGFIERGSTLLEKSIQIRILVREPKRNTGASKRLEIRPGRRGSEMSNFS